MNGLRRIVVLLILGCFFISFILAPVIRSVSKLVELARFKKSIPNFGNEIIKLSRQQRFSRKLIFVYSIFAVFMLLFGIITRDYLVLIGVLVVLPMVLDFVVIRKYTEYNGLYENGIVIGGYLEYNDVFSWKKVDANILSILKKDGIRFDIKCNGKQAEIIECFVAKGIAEEK